MQMIPYQPKVNEIKRAQLVPLGSGEYAGIHLFVGVYNLDTVLMLLQKWFGQRDEIILCASGTSDKNGLGFVVLEWEECEPDELFLTILDTEDVFIDYCRYVRA